MNRSLRCLVETLTMRYLGIPLATNPKKVETWKPILSKIEKKLSSWKSSLLLQVDKLVIIKVVINSLPIYYLGIFQMPRTMAKRIISLQTKFVWGKSSNKSCIPTIKWEQIQLPKEFGGLGIGDLMMKNATMLFKWWGRFFGFNQDQ